MLKKITITNVKGISSLEMDIDLRPNKPALFVAPNGFGKSSITTAFKSLNRNRIFLDDDHFHQNDSSKKPEIRLEYVDENKVTSYLIADEQQNQLSNVFDVVTITSLAHAKGSKQNNGRFTMVSASYVIDPIVLVTKIPEKKRFDYSFSGVKALFGKLGKALPNIGFLKEHETFFPSLLNACTIDSIAKTNQVRQQERIAEIIARLNSQLGGQSSEEILKLITASELDNFREIQHLKSIADHVRLFDFCANDEAKSYLIALQLSMLFKDQIDSLKEICKYSEFEQDKKNLSQIFADFNTSWQKFVPKEKKGSLVLDFPKLHHISNGQRDVMGFVAELQRAKKSLKNKKLILLIDEVFDYLDEANLVAVQYYMSMFVDEAKDRGTDIYPIIMTHLSPEYFHSYVFGSRLKLQIRYLRKYPNTVSDAMKKILRERSSATSPLKTPIENKLLHYHPVPINVRADFTSAGLKPTWGEPDVFYQHIDSEVKKYLSNDPSYDPMCVCCAVRVRIERLVFDLIGDPAMKTNFVDQITTGTSDKLDYASGLGVLIPDTYYLLGIVYNEGLHWRDDESFVSKIVTRLQNVTINGMIESIFKKESKI
jgi:hypothetical protein